MKDYKYVSVYFRDPRGTLKRGLKKRANQKGMKQGELARRLLSRALELDEQGVFFADDCTNCTKGVHG